MYLYVINHVKLCIRVNIMYVVLYASGAPLSKEHRPSK